MGDVNDDKKIDTAIGLLNSVVTQQAVLIEKMTSLTDKVARHDDTLYGNGKPGLNSRISTLETSISEIDEIKAALFGSDERVGLVSRVRSIQQDLERVSKLFWAAAIAAVTGTVGLIITLLGDRLFGAK